MLDTETLDYKNAVTIYNYQFGSVSAYLSSISSIDDKDDKAFFNKIHAKSSIKRVLKKNLSIKSISLTMAVNKLADPEKSSTNIPDVIGYYYSDLYNKIPDTFSTICHDLNVLNERESMIDQIGPEDYYYSRPAYKAHVALVLKLLLDEDYDAFHAYAVLSSCEVEQINVNIGQNGSFGIEGHLENWKPVSIDWFIGGMKLLLSKRIPEHIVLEDMKFCLLDNLEVCDSSQWTSWYLNPPDYKTIRNFRINR